MVVMSNVSPASCVCVCVCVRQWMVPLRLCSTSLPQDQTIVQRSRQFHFKGACVGLTNLTTLGKSGHSRVSHMHLVIPGPPEASQGSEDPCVPPVSTNPQGRRAKRSLHSAHLCRGYSAKWITRVKQLLCIDCSEFSFSPRAGSVASFVLRNVQRICHSC